MQIGDKFTIAGSFTRAYGRIGIGLLASPSSRSSFADATNNYAVSVNLDGPAYTGSGYGSWYLAYNGGATSAASFGGNQTNYHDFIFTFTLTAANRMNITVKDNTSSTTSTFNDVQLNTSNPITDYSIYLQDDYDGGQSRNAYWGLSASSNASIQSTGALSIGSSNTSFSIANAITDGYYADQTTSGTSYANALTKAGTGTVTLTAANTYTGLTTVSGGTLKLNNSGGGTLPSANNVTISNGGTLQISSNQTLNNVTLSSGGTLIIDNGVTLTINGTLNQNGGTITNNGSIAYGTNAILSYGGTSSQATGSELISSIPNLVINNSSGVALSSVTKLTKSLTITSGTLTTGGNLTLGSTASGTAYVAAISSGGISGNVTVQRWFPAQRAYRVLSTPFTATQNISAITNSLAVTGLSTATGSGTYASSSGNPSVFTYNATAAAGSALTGVTDATASIWKYTQPIYVMVRGQANEGNGLSSGQSGNSYTTGGGPTAFAISATGALNDGTTVADYSLQYSGGANNYNLVGNPYASPINLKLLKSNGGAINSNANIGGTFYVYNPYKSSTGAAVFAGGYDAYTNDGTTNVIIPSMGAFFIQAGAAGQTIQFAETAKSTGTPLVLMGTGSTTPKLRLTAVNSYGEMDALQVRIDAGAGNGSTDRYDAAKWSNINFDMYSIASDGSKLCIDARGNDVTVIPIGIKTNLTANDFTLKVTSIEGMEDKTVILRDKLLQTETVLKAANDSYTFSITKDTATKGDNRFELVLQNNKTTAVIDNTNNNTIAVQLSPNPVADQLTITLGKDAVSTTSVTNVRVLTADGQTLQTQQAGVGASSIKVGLQGIGKGILLVEVKNDKVSSVQKVVKE